MHQSRDTKRVGAIPSVLRGFNVSDFHRTEAEYEDRIPDGTVLAADTGERFPPIGPLALPLPDVIHNSRRKIVARRPDPDDEIPYDLRMLAGGSNFLMEPENHFGPRYRPMGDPEEIHSKILDAHD